MMQNWKTAIYNCGFHIFSSPTLIPVGASSPFFYDEFFFQNDGVSDVCILLYRYFQCVSEKSCIAFFLADLCVLFPPLHPIFNSVNSLAYIYKYKNRVLSLERMHQYKTCFFSQRDLLFRTIFDQCHEQQYLSKVTDHSIVIKFSRKRQQEKTATSRQ